MNIKPLSFLLLLTAATGCISTKSEVDVKPVEIHVTVDVNVKVQVDKELENVFGDLDNHQAVLQSGEEE